MKVFLKLGLPQSSQLEIMLVKYLFTSINRMCFRGIHYSLTIDLMQYFVEEYPDFLKDSELNRKTEEEQDGRQEIKTTISDAMIFYEGGVNSSNITSSE